MELRARIRPHARRAALVAAIGALLVPAVASTATAATKTRTSAYPVVTSVIPMRARIGDTIVIRGKGFIRGKNRNTVVFKMDGKRAIFAKNTLGTRKQVSVVIPESLRTQLSVNQTARFHLRVLSKRFSKFFTPNSKSPSITAQPLPVSGSTGSTGSTGSGTPTGNGAQTAKVCTGDEDHDGLDASLELSLGLDPCNPDTDGDGVPDGYEYKSAWDLNDNEYQQPNSFLPYPGKTAYPNPLFADANVDYDGDGLPMAAEYALWAKYGDKPAGGLFTESYQLLYSDGEQYSLSTRNGQGHRVPAQPAATYSKQGDFLAWAGANGYNPVTIPVAPTKSTHWYDIANQHSFDIRDVNLDGVVSASEANPADVNKDGWISDNERDEDADGLSNLDELNSRGTPTYWEKCYSVTSETPFPISYAGTDLTNPDSDGDGVRDGADDQDHDDLPNMMELSRFEASGGVSNNGFRDWVPGKGTCSVDARLKSGPDIDGDGNPDWVVLHPDDAQTGIPQYGRVNPYNPCEPFVGSRTCPLVQAFDKDKYAPFDGSPWYALQ
ncbi:MAG: hypothetical protein QOE28_2072 [Solirubrobacteraceae bacterium]|jgi:hypothetical protein|nr:hypothetical protein [Solirubrobacteraceae bacterium]